MRQTDLSQHSLQQLHSISLNEQFSHQVQTLHVNKEWDEDLKPRLGRGFYWHRMEETDMSRRVDTQLSSGARMLQDVLTRLVNCTSFRFGSTYGLEEQYEPEYLSPSDAIGLVLRIIVEISLPVKSFYIDFEAQKRQAEVDAKRLQTQIFRQPAFIAAWGNLEELRLEYRLKSDSLEWGLGLVSNATSLKVLSLDLHFPYPISFIDSLLSLPFSLQVLQELELASFVVAEDTLLAFLLLCRSNLRRLSFRWIFIRPGKWVPILAALKTFQFLENFAVGFASESGTNILRARIQFPSLETNPIVPGSGGKSFELQHHEHGGKMRVWGASFHSRVGMQRALEILAESTVHTLRDN
ncbi:hypothetical protein MMC20_004261 [Loxospora ochrophaea]|nr:hypothetical protein [Loxospora ochrophaea]